MTVQSAKEVVVQDFLAVSEQMIQDTLLELKSLQFPADAVAHMTKVSRSKLVDFVRYSCV
jgi:RNA-binding protein YlmH